jgi:hypothetical protein
MTRGQEFQFICAADMAGKMDRIVIVAGGVICLTEQHPEGTVMIVRKAE